MPFEVVKHPNGKTARVIRIPELPTETPMTEDEDLILALGRERKELRGTLEMLVTAPGVGAPVRVYIHKFLKSLYPKGMTYESSGIDQAPE